MYELQKVILDYNMDLDRDHHGPWSDPRINGIWARAYKRKAPLFELSDFKVFPMPYPKRFSILESERSIFVLPT